MPTALGAVRQVIRAQVQSSGTTLTALATIPIADESVVFIDAWVVGRRTNGADRAGYRRRAVIYRTGGGAATFEGGLDTPLSRESNGPWNALIDVDGGNNARIMVRAETGHDVDWIGEYTLTVES